MPTSNFVTAWRKDSGAKVRIPKRWVGHPVHGAPFTTTEPKATPATPDSPPTNKAADAAKGK